MGAYLDLADEVNRLPTRVTFQSGWQRSGFVGVQLQCFCRSQKPMPSLLKSVAKHVGLLLSDISTPFCISCTMITLVSSKRVSRLSVHLNTEFGFRRLRKGFILSADANAYATWLINPNQLLTSVILRGLGNSLIASVTCGHRRTKCGCDFKACEGYCIFCELELGWIKDDAVSTTNVQPFSCLEEAVID